MTDENEVPSLTDEALRAFMLEAETDTERGDKVRERLKLAQAKASAFQMQVGYIPASSRQQDRDLYDKVYHEIEQYFQNRGEYIDGQQVAEIADVMFNGKLSTYSTLELLVVAMLTQDDSEVSATEADQQKRRVIAEAIIYSDVHLDDPLIHFMNTALPGKAVDLRGEDMLNLYDQLIASETDRERAIEAVCDHLTTVMIKIGLDPELDEHADLMPALSLIIDFAEATGRLEQASRYQRECNVLSQARDIGLDEVVARKLLDHVNQEYPIP